MSLQECRFEVEIAYSYRSSGIPIVGTRYKQYNLSNLKEMIQAARITNPNVKVRPIIKWILEDATLEFCKEAKKAALKIISGAMVSGAEVTDLPNSIRVRLIEVIQKRKYTEEVQGDDDKRIE